MQTRHGFAFRHVFNVEMTACTKASCESKPLCGRSRRLGERASVTGLTFGDGASGRRWQHSHALRWQSTRWGKDVRAVSHAAAATIDTRTTRGNRVRDT